MFGNNKPVNIRREKLVKTVKVKNHDVEFSIENVSTAEIDGNREVLDEVMIDNMIDGIASSIVSNKTKYNPIPSKICIVNDQNEKDSADPASESPEKDKAVGEIIESYDPKYSLDDVILNSDVKDKIRVAISAVKHKVYLCEHWGLAEQYGGNRAIILNFYGKPGTGKTMASEAVASALGKKVYHINYADLESKYVGETPKNIKKAFARATEDDAVLVFDEADSFLGKRLTSVTQSADYGVNITRSVLLMELEKFTGVVIFTTNLIKNYDEAFKRRILLSIYFEMPDLDARRDIWKLHLGSKLPVDDGITTELLAEKYDSLSGADIKDMVFYAALHALEKGNDKVDSEAFDNAYEAIKERYKDKTAEWETKVLKTEQITEEEYLRETKGESVDA